MKLEFRRESVRAAFLAPDGAPVEREVELRTNPITGRISRISTSRGLERERGVSRLPDPPPEAGDTATCPFCHPHLTSQTPRVPLDLDPEGRLRRGEACLFPNLFPYGPYSAVAIFDGKHFVEIGEANLRSYAECLAVSVEYLCRVTARDPAAAFTAITQNHLPSSGGSLLHPHLQIQADRIASNHHRFLMERARQYRAETGSRLLSDYLEMELGGRARFIGQTGPWGWLAAFAPEGFFEIWGILPGVTTVRALTSELCGDLARGFQNIQRFYRSLNRNGYNAGMLSIERDDSALELRMVFLVRSNFAPWARNDRTAFELLLGDMMTFSTPERTAELARPFWT